MPKIEYTKEDYDQCSEFGKFIGEFPLDGLKVADTGAWYKALITMNNVIKKMREGLEVKPEAPKVTKPDEPKAAVKPPAKPKVAKK